ncbi:LysM peptidoglycan-binding domain-containing protein [Paenibacillus doosanensis]|uniref:LysM peptidoglycan-binding domain-containing protein n=1 Tax=Paenibacillus doosanensis TaxID=1229154 RepID=UPI0021801C74|nr:LysM peptidoglycan-binding domain-containing protein [Paenibacillus doosanensis]MCS7458706.1 LysM peptidoglycan-binding domain-containing protein [Paenibacillus doosanensis]
MKIHMVKKGESLYQIAQKYNVDLDKLIELNPQIADPNVIDVGMKVKIPNAPKPVEPPSDYLYKHTVVQGDTLWKLSKAWNIPLNDLIAANPQLKNPNVLMTGDVVFIPKTGGGHHHHHNQQSNQNTYPYPHHPDKKNTAPIETKPAEQTPAPEAPNTNVSPITEVPQPNVEMPVMPNINQGPQFMPEMTAMPNMNQGPQFMPEMAAMPNMNQGPQFMPEMTAMPNMNQGPQFMPEMTAMPNMNQGPQFMPEMTAMPNMNQGPQFMPESTGKPEMNQAPQFMPESTGKPEMNQAPTFSPESTFMPSSNQKPQYVQSEQTMPQQWGPPPGPLTDNAFGMMPQATPNMPFQPFQQPSANLFQQFQVPAVEAMSYNQPNFNAWPQQQPPFPPMQAMPSANQMPYQNFAAPMASYPQFGPNAGGCGCGGQVSPAFDQAMPYGYGPQMENPFMAQSAGQPFPGMPFPNMGMPFPNAPYPTAVSPTSEAPCYPFEPAMNTAFPGPVYPMYGQQVSPFSAPFEEGPSGKSKGRDDEEQEEYDSQVTISRKAEQTTAKNAKKKRKSPEAAISRLVKNTRRNRSGSNKSTSQKTPWINL